MDFYLPFSTVIMINIICILPTLLYFCPFLSCFFFFGRILDKSVLMKEGLALIYNFAGKIHYVGENTVMGEQRADRSHGTCSSGTREI